VIDDVDAQDLPRFDEFPREEKIISGRFGRTARMVMEDDDAVLRVEVDRAQALLNMVAVLDDERSGERLGVMDRIIHERLADDGPTTKLE